MNGDLLHKAQGSFDVLLTADRRLRFQQNLPRYDIGFVVILTPNLRFRVIRSAIEAMRSAIATVKPGEVIQVQVS